ncbi:MAG: double-strand break repair helicase AddA, partial [Beijerinckiaceae bacterium]
NAGSGKTEVLVRRVIRLMLGGVKPDEILCLTYTKAAAAEMTNRVFKRLAEWTALDDEGLRGGIRDLTGGVASAPRLRRARRLFADALETPGGLKIQTIHAFCERLLHLFPFDAGAPAHFEVLDETEQSDFLEQAIAEIASGDDASVSEAFERVAEDIHDEGFRDVLKATLIARAECWSDATIRAMQVQRLAETLGVDESGKTCEALRDYFANPFWSADVKSVIGALRKHPGAINDAAADKLTGIAEATNLQQRLDFARGLFCRKGNDAASPNQLMTEKARKAVPDAASIIDVEANRFAALLDRIDAIESLERNRALYVLADAILAHYGAAKAQRGALDFADLIAKTRALLANPGIGPWVLYKLDSNLSHILVDEAQDTSEAQWDIIRRLAEEFTAGAGARDPNRTVFAVGDEKQSIYSFQGASPKSFAEMRAIFNKRHDDAGRDFRHIRLIESFRSAPEVLSAVDEIFSNPLRRQGLSFGDDVAPTHVSSIRRQKEIGFVELWPLEVKANPPQIDNYLDPDEAGIPDEDAAPEAPHTRLARRIADNVRSLLRNGDPTGQSVAPGQIMILVRRRNALFDAMIAALKQAGVRVAGADRLKVAQHLAVMDCLAAGRTALAPDDDYALACALKSPLIGLSDEDLLTLAPGRRGSLDEALRKRASTGSVFAGASDAIARWRAAATGGPFAFFASLLEAEGGRRKLTARLGAEAGDALDEFLARALDFERRESASLAGFLAAFEATDLEIKRDLDQAADEVRVMTVHAAKGLEADIVILPDTASAPGGRPTPLVNVAIDANGTSLATWSPRKGRAAAIQRARSESDRSILEEHRRLLYVALTRARRGLIIAGATGLPKLPENSWYAHVRDALSASSQADAASSGVERRGALVERPARDRGEDKFSYWMLPNRELGSASTAAPSPRASLAVLPLWTGEPAIPEAPADALSPSRTASAADRRERPFDPAGAAHARARGKLVHRLLEIIPSLAPDLRERAALRLAARIAPTLAPDLRRELVMRAVEIVGDARWAALFGPNSRAEVSAAGTVSVPGKGQRRVAGVIDRLATTEDEVLIADFKTGLRPPQDVTDIDDRILAQLALYRALIAPLYPTRQIRCFVIWTAGPLAHELDDALLDRARAGQLRRRVRHMPAPRRKQAGGVTLP